MCFLPLQTVENDAVTNANEIADWCRRDCTVRNYIYATVTDDLRDTLCTSTNAVDMYQRVRNQHARAAAENKLILLRQFTEYRFKTGHNVTMHVTAIEILWSRRRDIGELIPESQVISKIFSTLPSSYRHFYTTWNNDLEFDQINNKQIGQIKSTGFDTRNPASKQRHH